MQAMSNGGEDVKKLKLAVITISAVSAGFLAVGYAYLRSGVQQREQPEKTFDNYLHAGQYYYDQGDYSTALVSYRSALEVDGSSIDALRGRSECLEALGYRDDAEDSYRELISSSDNVVEDTLSLVNLEIASGQLDQAKTDTEKLMNTTDDPRVGQLYANMTVAPPSFDVQSGSYDDYQFVELKDPESVNGTVYYTTDGSEPDSKSTRYNDGIIVTEPENHIRAITIGYLGYKSEETDLDITITRQPKDISHDRGLNVFEWRVRNQFDLNYDDPIYDYQAAQITELYSVGNNTTDNSDDHGITFSKDSYTWYSSTETYRGKMDDEDLSYYPFLKTLVIGYAENLNLQGLKGMTHLENLSLINDGITDVSALKNLTNLQQLALGWNDIPDVSALSNMTELTSLGLWNNSITDISSLKNLTKLQYLDVSHNQISDISAISGMGNLSELWVNDNQIQDLSPVTAFPNLHILYQGGNPGADSDSLKTIEDQLTKSDLQTNKD